jgi:long-subunit fatty acid transport protein
VTFNAGIMVVLPGDVKLGAAYRSKALGLERTNIEASGQVKVTRYDQDVGRWVDVEGRVKLYYELPDSVVVGAEWRPTKEWELDIGFEWLHFSVHKDIQFKLSGNEFRAANMGNWDVNFRHYRGFNDVWRVQVGGAYHPIKGLRLGGALLYESAAVDPKWVNAAAMGGHKLGAMLSAEWYPHRSVSLHVGYGVQLTPPVDVSPSGYDPSLMTSCITNQVDIIWNDECNQVSEGKGMPTAAGDYWFITHKVGLGVAYHYR